MLDLLSSLVDKSLVTVTEPNGRTRYRMTESVRQYARVRLAELGGSIGASADGSDAAGHEDCLDLHAAFYLALAEEAEPHLTERDQLAWMERLEVEHDNLRAALQRCLEGPAEGERGMRLAGALWRFWYQRGYLSEGRAWLSAILTADMSGKVTSARARALGGAGSLAHEQSDIAAARSLHEESLAMRRQLGDMPAVASALNNLGTVAMSQGDLASARRLVEESIAIRREIGHTWGLAIGLANLGHIAMEQGDYAGARQLLDESLSLLRKLGDRAAIASVLNSLSLTATAQGEYASAQGYLEDSVELSAEAGDQTHLASAIANMGNVAFYLGDYVTAQSLYDKAITMFRELGRPIGVANSLTGLASVAQVRNDRTGAVAMLVDAITIFRDIGSTAGILNCLLGLASASAEHVDPLVTVTILGGEQRIREEIGTPLPPNNQPRYQSEVAQARAAVGNDAGFDAAWQAGRGMSMEQAVDYALRNLAPTPANGP